MDIVGDLEVKSCRLQILPNGEDIATMLDEVVHDLEHLILRLTQTDHHTRLGALAVCLGALDLFKASCILGLRAYLAVELLNCLHIMRNHFLPGADHLFKGFPVGPNIRDQSFNGRGRRHFLHSSYCPVPDISPPVLEFITIDRSKHCMFDLHQFNGLCHSFRFVDVILGRSTRFDCTKGAGSCTDIP